MSAPVLEEIERELLAVVDDLTWQDEDSAFNRQIDQLRHIARKIGVEVEAMKRKAS